LLFNKFIYFIIFLIGIIIPAYCNELPPELLNEYSVEMLTEEDGVVSSEIYSIIQDSQGLLWFGTAENGLMRYDGRKISLFEFDSTNASGLSHNDAGNLMLDNQGRIWVGTWGGGANLYLPQKGTFQHFIHDPKRTDSISSNRIQSLFHDQEGTIWLGSYDNGLNRYLGNNRFEHIEKIESNESSLSHNRIWDMEDHDIDNLWVATSFGLNLYNKKKNTASYFFPAPDNLTPTGSNEIRDILKTSKNELYIGTQNGLFTFDLTKATFTSLKTNTGENLGRVNSMIEDQEGYIWIVSNTGLFRQSNSSAKIEKFELEHNHDLRIIFEDSSSTIWVTSETQGIFKLVPHRKFKSINSSALIAPNAITLDKQGNLLIVTALSELYKWHVSSQKLEKLSSPIFSGKDHHSGNRSLERPVIFLDEKNNIWVAQDDNLASFDLKTKKIKLLEYPKSDQNYKEFRELRALNTDKHGNLWIGTYKKGIYQYNPKIQDFIHLDDSLALSHPEIIEIFKDNEQNIWVATGDGLNRWDEENQRFITFISDKNIVGSLLGKNIQDIHQSKDGRIWLATQKGLYLYLPDTNTFKHYGRKNGLPTSLIRAVADDRNGHIWLTTNKGISQLNPLSGEVINFNSYNGLLGLNYYQNSLVAAKDEMLFTSSQRGIEFFNTSPIEENTTEYNIVLTGFNKMGKPVKLDTPYTYVSDIKLSHLDYFFSFEFSVLDFVSPNKNLYAYKLEGYDDNWINIGNRNEASFTNLDGGSYRFLVKATNSSGKWGEKTLAINLTISPPPWRTWWAYSLYILATLLIIFLVIYFRTRFQQKEIAIQKKFVVELEEQVVEKTASLNTQAQDLIEANQQLEILTYQDGLTGLYNRRYFDKRLTEELNRHYRQNQPLSLILADIDHFKRFNDFYGHQKGDDCLKQVAQCIITSVSRITDANCRYGGEEFAIILPNTSIIESTIVAERVCSAIENMHIPHEKSETSPFVTLTLGVVTVIPESTTSVDSIVLGADKALYFGKSNGRNRVSRTE
jgi:diguanylate cyclase (GGDEF)-like protein